MSQRGFTLIELVIVIAIIGIAASLAVPIIGDWQASQGMDNSSRQLAGSIRMLNQGAINAGSTQAANQSNITVNAGNYIFTMRNADSSDSTKTVIAKTATTTLPQTMRASATVIRFSLEGLICDASGNRITANQEITLTSNRSGIAQRKIIINGMTGRVTIE